MGNFKDKRKSMSQHLKNAASNDYQAIPSDGEESPGYASDADGFFGEEEPPAAPKVPSKMLLHLSTMENLEAEDGPIDDLLKSTPFQATMAVFIMANAVVIGLETDVQSFDWDGIENFFLLIFTAELGAKYYAQRMRWFFSCNNPDVGWNLFDIVIVGLGVTDFVMSLAFNNSGGGTATLFRIIRLLRIMRLFRIVKFLKQLYLLAFGFVEAIQAIFWVTLLLLVILYVCAIVMVRTCGRLPPEDPHAEFLHENFANIGTSMLTLFVLMSSPNLPKYIEQDDLLWHRPLLLVFLVSFIIIGSFGMIALLTGVISESMFEKNQIRAEESRKEQDDLIRRLGAKADEIHSMLELTEEGDATKEDIATFAMPLVARLYEEAMIDFTEHNLEKLVEVMDHGGDGLVNAHEFKSCVITYASGVKPLSIQEVHYNTAVCINKLGIVQEMLESMKQGRREEDSDVGARSAGLWDRPPEWFEEAHSGIVTCTSKLEGVEGQLHLLANRLSEVGIEMCRPTADLRLPVCSTDNVGASSTGCSDEDPSKGNGNLRVAMDSTRIADALRDLDTCIRDCTRRQLSGQQYLETCIRENVKHVGKQTGDQLKKHIGDQLQETLKALSGSWKLAELSEQLQEKLVALTACMDRAKRESRGPPVMEGFHIGERVRASVDLKFPDGQISKGDIGFVRGPALGEDSKTKKINVDFQYVKGVNLLPGEISKEMAERTKRPNGSRPAEPASGVFSASSGARASASGKPPAPAPVPAPAPASASASASSSASAPRTSTQSEKAANVPSKEIKKQSSTGSLQSSSTRDGSSSVSRQVTIDTRPPEEAEAPTGEPKKLTGPGALQSSLRDRGASSLRQVSIGVRPAQASSGDSRDPLIQLDSGDSGESGSKAKLLKTLPACLLDV